MTASNMWEIKPLISSAFTQLILCMLKGKRAEEFSKLTEEFVIL